MLFLCIVPLLTLGLAERSIFLGHALLLCSAVMTRLSAEIAFVAQTVLSPCQLLSLTSVVLFRFSGLCLHSVSFYLLMFVLPSF